MAISTKKTVFLTGATGNMGSATLAELLARSDRFRVRALVRPEERNHAVVKRFERNPAVEWVWGDLTSAQDMRQAVEGVDQVLHIGGMVSPFADKFPELTMKVNVGGARNIVEAIKAAALDYLALPLDPERFTRCLLRIEKEAEQFGAARRRMIEARDRISTLSTREREVLEWLSEGSSNKAIAREFDISPRTVEIHRANMLNKMGANHTSEAIRIAIEAALVD